MTSRLPLLLVSLMLLLLAIPASAADTVCEFSADPETAAYFNPKEISMKKAVAWDQKGNQVSVSGLPKGVSVAMGAGDDLFIEGITSVDGELGGGLYGFYILPYVEREGPRSIGCQTFINLAEPAKTVTVLVSNGPEGAVQALFDDTDGKESINFKMSTARAKLTRNEDGDITGILIGLNQPGIIAILIGL